MSIASIGSTFSILYEKLCESADAHNLNPDKNKILESLHGPLSTALETLSPIKNKVPYVNAQLTKTHKLFHETVKKFAEVEIPLVNRFLISCYRANGYVDDAQGIASARTITEFYGDISPLMEPLVTREYPAASLVMRHSFCDECILIVPELRRIHDIMRLENDYERALPLRALVDAALGRTPEASQLDRFILNFVAKKIESALLHRALEAIFYHAMIFHRNFADELDPQPLTLSRFELSLEQRFDKITGGRPKDEDHLLTRQGSKHLKWRSGLTKGYKLSTVVHISLNGEPKTILLDLLLNDPLPSKKKSFNTNILFTISKIITKSLPKDQVFNGLLNPLYDDSQADEIDIGLPPVEDLLVWISSNRSRIDLRLEAQSRHFGPPIAKTFIVAHDGKFAVVEKLKMQLGGELWGSVMKQSNYQDLIIRMLTWLKSQHYSPLPFKYKYYGLSEDNILCATRLNTRTAFNIEALEIWAYKTARKDPQLFKQYSLGAQLRENSSAKIIVEAALKTFSDEKFDIDYQIKLHRPDDPDLKTKALTLQEKIKNRYQELKNNPTLSSYDKNVLQESILEHYKNSGAITLLLPMEPLRL